MLVYSPQCVLTWIGLVNKESEVSFQLSYNNTKGVVSFEKGIITFNEASKLNIPVICLN